MPKNVTNPSRLKLCNPILQPSYEGSIFLEIYDTAKKVKANFIMPKVQIA